MIEILISPLPYRFGRAIQLVVEFVWDSDADVENVNGFFVDSVRSVGVVEGLLSRKRRRIALVGRRPIMTTDERTRATASRISQGRC